MGAISSLSITNNRSSSHEALCGVNVGTDNLSVGDFSSKRKVEYAPVKTENGLRIPSFYSISSAPPQTGRAIDRLVGRVSEPEDCPEYCQLMSGSLVNALKSYDVPISRLLEAVKKDCETGTGNVEAADVITDYLFGERTEVDMGYLEWFRFLGARIDKKTVFPRMELMKTVILRLEEIGHGNLPVRDALKACWNQTKLEEGGFFHQFLTSLANSQMPVADSQHLTGSDNEPCHTSKQTNGDSDKLKEKSHHCRSVRQSTALNRISTLFASVVTFFSSSVLVSADTAATPEPPHNSDNATESNDRCPADEFECAKTRVCIPRTKICNHRNDCGRGDRSDESPEACQNYCEDTGRFHCPETTQCISQNLTCNQDFDCWNGEDEKRPPCPCLPGLYLCPDKSRCIEHEKDCDGKQDCYDGSDERLELCQKKLNVEINDFLISHPNYLDKLHKVCCTAEEELTAEQILKRFRLRYFNCSSGRVGGDDCEHLCEYEDDSYAVIQCGLNYNAKCIEKYELCDGTNHCGQDRDEFPPLCHLKCDDDEVPCGDGKCITKAQLLDRNSHCPNGRDNDLFTIAKEYFRLDSQEKCQFYASNEKKQCHTEMKKTCCETVKQRTAERNRTHENTLSPTNTTAVPSGTSVAPMNTTSAPVNVNTTVEPMDSTPLAPNTTFPLPLANSSQNGTGLPPAPGQAGGAAAAIGFVPTLLMGLGFAGFVLLTCGTVALYRYKKYGYILRPGTSHPVEDGRQPLSPPDVEMDDREVELGAVNEVARMGDVAL